MRTLDAPIHSGTTEKVLTAQLPATPPLYRLHVKTGAEDHAASFKFCLDNHVLGMGWNGGHKPVTWSGYKKAVTRKWGGVDASVKTIHDLPTGAFIWTRDRRGVYYLARVTGAWHHLHSKASFYNDVHNVKGQQESPLVAR